MVCTAFEITGPHLVWRGDTRYIYNSTSSTKQSDNVFERVNLSCQCHGCRNSCSEHSTPICFETTPTQLRLYIWPIYIGKAPAKTYSQLRDANLTREKLCFCYSPDSWTGLPFLSQQSHSAPSSRPAPVTCLHPNAGLFVLAPTLEDAAMVKVPTLVVVNQDVEKNSTWLECTKLEGNYF